LGTEIQTEFSAISGKQFQSFKITWEQEGLQNKSAVLGTEQTLTANPQFK
jgi:hypothetical protein